MFVGMIKFAFVFMIVISQPQVKDIPPPEDHQSGCAVGETEFGLTAEGWR